MKKNILLLGAVSLMYTIAWSQSIVVKDKTTLQPIQLAIVNSLSEAGDSQATLTDDKGMADISQMRTSNSIRIHIVGYQPYFSTYIKLRENNGEVLLSESSHMFNEVVVSANRFAEKQRDIAQPVEVISSREIAFSNANTAADVISNTGNVLVQKSQQGGGSPIIRGFETNKVLLVVDGVRMNNAIYRGGHIQNIITLDNAIMDRVEILYGPGSVMYGSDALGGVMHFFTKNPTLSSTSTLAAHGNAFARYSTAADEKTFHADLSLGMKLGSLTSFTYSDFGDLTQGSDRDDKYPNFGKRTFYAERQNEEDVQVINDDPDVQIGSSYTQYDFLQKFTYMQSENVSHALNIQYSTSTDIPRYDRLSETANGVLRFGDWYYGPQERMLAAYSLHLDNQQGLFNRGRITAAYQKIEESRHDRRFGREFINHRTEQVDVLTLNADFAKDVGNSEWRYGLEGTTNHVDSKANQESLLTGEAKGQTTRYPSDGSDVSSAAIYLSD
ncbi:MAG: TonB-dependent receptor plug domain-containing protein, partial [Bacteroidota bacterium]|nr:TonB-dependent receptor plug domain-containing protein [Bacteroidota bacterium]